MGMYSLLRSAHCETGMKNIQTTKRDAQNPCWGCTCVLLVRTVLCEMRDFAASLVVETPHFDCRGRRFNPWSGSQDPTCHQVRSKNRKKSLIFYSSFSSIFKI